MESILHILGACGDNQSHIDLIDVIIMLGGGGAGLITIKAYYQTTIHIIKEFINNIFK